MRRAYSAAISVLKQDLDDFAGRHCVGWALFKRRRSGSWSLRSTAAPAAAVLGT